MKTSEKQFNIKSRASDNKSSFENYDQKNLYNKNKKSIKFCVALISMVFLLFFAIFILLYLNKDFLSGFPSNTEEKSVEQKSIAEILEAANAFTDSELGVSFNYPSSWGVIKIDNGLIPTGANYELRKTLSFSNQPNLFFEIISPALMSDEKNLQIPVEYIINLSDFCKEKQPYSHLCDKSRCVDEFVICPNNNGNISAIVNRTITSGGVKKIAKRFYIKTKNPLYGPLIVYQIGIPDLESRTEFDKQIEKILSEMKITAPDNAQQYFKNYFKDLVKYTDPQNQFSYIYPEIFTYYWDYYNFNQYFSDYKILPQLKNRDFDFLVAASTKELITGEEKDFEECINSGGCGDSGPFILTSAVWDDEKQLLNNAPLDGSIQCVQSLNRGKSLCEIKTINKNKFLLRYTGIGGGDSLVEKSYIIYKGNIRYEINFPDLGSQGTDPNLYKKIENQFIQKIYEDIVKSLMLL